MLKALVKNMSLEMEKIIIKEVESKEKDKAKTKKKHAGKDIRE